MVEFVIILPLLLMIVFAIAEFGIVFGRWQSISNAAREGARTAIVFRTDCVAGDVVDEVRDRVRLYTAPLGISLADEAIAVEGACDGSGTNTTVNVESAYTFLVLPGFASSLSPSVNLVGRSVMRNEG